MQQINRNGYTRINKTRAKNMFMKGIGFIAVPCNLVPNSMSACSITPKAGECSEKDFENAINACMYYNCNAEAGKQLFFYVIDKEYAKKYRLTSTFEKAYNVQNILTGKVSIVDKKELVDKVKRGEVEVIGHMVDPVTNELTKYR